MASATGTAETAVIDTDVASMLIRGNLPAAAATKLADFGLCTTFVTVGELFRGAVHAQWGTRRVAALTEWLGRIDALPADGDVAQRWGQITGGSLRAGRPLPGDDAWVAACCLSRGLPLATLNRRDYERIDGLDLLL